MNLTILVMLIFLLMDVTILVVQLCPFIFNLYSLWYCEPISIKFIKFVSHFVRFSLFFLVKILELITSLSDNNLSLLFTCTYAAYNNDFHNKPKSHSRDLSYKLI